MSVEREHLHRRAVEAKKPFKKSYIYNNCFHNVIFIRGPPEASQLVAEGDVLRVCNKLKVSLMKLENHELPFFQDNYDFNFKITPYHKKSF